MSTPTAPPDRKERFGTTELTESRVIYTRGNTTRQYELTPETDGDTVVDMLQELVSAYESATGPAETTRLTATVHDGGDISIQDRRGGEWLVWTRDEWMRETDKPDGNTEQRTIWLNQVKMIVKAVTLAYEDPARIESISKRTQIEFCGEDAPSSE